MFALMLILMPVEILTMIQILIAVEDEIDGRVVFLGTVPRKNDGIGGEYPDLSLHRLL